MKKWFVYIVRCSGSSLYTGITNDIKKRIFLHNSGKGAKYTRSRRPVVLVWKRAVATESRARKLEAKIKSCTRKQKINLVNHGRL